MSEKLPIYEHYDIASLARDIVMHHGQANTTASDETVIKATWDYDDHEQAQVWQLALLTTSPHMSLHYQLDARVLGSSTTHRYKYNVAQCSVSYDAVASSTENPNYSQDQLIAQLHNWLKTGPAIEAVSYDNEELQRQLLFTYIGARIAVHELLETAGGESILAKLSNTDRNDQGARSQLHQRFYNLSRQSDSRFSISSHATRVVLEELAQERARQKMITEQSQNVPEG